MPEINLGGLRDQHLSEYLATSYVLIYVSEKENVVSEIKLSVVLYLRWVGQLRHSLRLQVFRLTAQVCTDYREILLGNWFRRPNDL
jgi:hypothetical protein